VNLTDARRRALLVVAAGEKRGTYVRYSNRTTDPDDPALGVYWQTADWLIGAGLVADELGPIRDGLRLTPAGHELARRFRPPLHSDCGTRHRPGTPCPDTGADHG